MYVREAQHKRVEAHDRCGDGSGVESSRCDCLLACCFTMHCMHRISPHLYLRVSVTDPGYYISSLKLPHGLRQQAVGTVPYRCSVFPTSEAPFTTRAVVRYSVRTLTPICVCS